MKRAVWFSGGRDRRFLDLLRASAENLRAMVDLLGETAETMRDVAGRARQAKELEERGDSYTHELVALINRTFVTPLDREDLFDLAVRVDDIVDQIEAAMSRLAIYRLEGQVDPYVRRFAGILKESSAEIAVAVELLRRRELFKLRDHAVRLNVLENDGDAVLREALESLFGNGADALTVLKWKEIYELLEEATDACEDVANALESVAMKHA